MKGRRKGCQGAWGRAFWGKGKKEQRGGSVFGRLGSGAAPEHGQWGLAAADPVSNDSMGERTECPLMQSAERGRYNRRDGLSSTIPESPPGSLAWWAGEQGERDKGRRAHSPCVSAVVGQSARFWQHRRQMRRAEGSISET